MQHERVISVVVGKIVPHLSSMARALYKARNTVIDGFYIIISSLNNVLKLRHSAQHRVTRTQ